MRDQHRLLAVALLTVATSFSGCHGAPLGASNASRPEADLRIADLEVSEQTLRAVLVRGNAQVTFRAERGAPIDYEKNGWKRDPEIDPPGDSRWVLTDRKDQLISIVGDSLQNPGAWEAMLKKNPVRTNDELDQDLKVAVAGADVLSKDERVQRWFRWEIRLVRGAAKDLLGSKTPTEHENTK